MAFHQITIRIKTDKPLTEKDKSFVAERTVDEAFESIVTLDSQYQIEDISVEMD